MRLAARLIAACTLLLAARAVAQPARVVLLVEDQRGALRARLVAEIRTLGFDVELRDSSGARPDPAALELAARDAGAVAAIQIASTAGTVEAWIVDRVTGKTVIRRVATAAEAANGALVALRAVELLRGSLIEIRMAAPPRGEVPPPAAVEALVRRDLPAPGPRLSVVLAGGAALSPGGVGPGGVFELDARLRLSPAFALEAGGALPFLAPEVTAPEGRSEVALRLVTVGVLWTSGGAASGFGAHAGGGIGALWLRFDGLTAAPGYRAEADTVVAALPYARIGVTYAVARWLRVGASGMVGAAAPWPRVAFAGRAVADFGLPLVIAGLAVEVLP